MKPGDRIYQDHRRHGVILVVTNTRALVSWRPAPKAAEWLDLDPTEVEPLKFVNVIDHAPTYSTEYGQSP